MKSSCAGIAVAAIVVASAATACGGSGSPSGSASPGNSTAATSGALNPNGTLRLSASLSLTAGGKITFDPTQATVQSINVPWQLPVYDSLLHRNPSTGAFEPGLATSVTVVNPETVTITLRSGVKFTDGTAFDANAVKVGLLRNKNAKQAGQFDSSLQMISSIDVTDPLHLTVHLSAPVAGQFYDQMCLPSTYIVSPAAVAKESDGIGTAPVGAGPFMLKSFVPNQSITLVKNPNYWDASAIKLASIQFVNIVSSPQEVESLEAGTVDLTQLTSFTSPVALKGQFSVAQVVTSHAPLWSDVCKTSSPLDNVKVRQALNYAIDRDQIIKTVLAGYGTPAWSLWPQGTPYYDQSLSGIYNYDPKKAKALLAHAGYANGFSISMVQFAGTSTAQTDQILQQEWGAIGVKLAIVPSQNPVVDLYLKHVAPIGVTNGSAVGSYGPVSGFAPGTISDLCNYNDPSLTALYGQAKAVDPTSPQGVSIFRQMQRQIYQQALGIFIATTPMLFAYDSNVKNLTMNPYYTIVPMPDYWSGVEMG